MTRMDAMLALEKELEQRDLPRFLHDHLPGWAFGHDLVTEQVWMEEPVANGHRIYGRNMAEAALKALLIDWPCLDAQACELAQYHTEHDNGMCWCVNCPDQDEMPASCTARCDPAKADFRLGEQDDPGGKLPCCVLPCPCRTPASLGRLRGFLRWRDQRDWEDAKEQRAKARISAALKARKELLPKGQGDFYAEIAYAPTKARTLA